MPLLVVTFLGNSTFFSIRFELSCEFSWSWLSLLVVFRLFAVHRSISSLVSLFFFLKQLHFDSLFFSRFSILANLARFVKIANLVFKIFFTIFWWLSMVFFALFFGKTV